MENVLPNGKKREKETYHTDNSECYAVGRKFHNPDNKAIAIGGPTIYFSNLQCRKRVGVDLDGKGEALKIASRIKSFRALNFECDANNGTNNLKK
ncbi:hypothetical protein GGH93_004775 [Coemansia aciculifera]|nr:hypothetical protein GGH93_004775 [Coemansia aciculifera]